MNRFPLKKSAEGFNGEGRGRQRSRFGDGGQGFESPLPDQVLKHRDGRGQVALLFWETGGRGFKSHSPDHFVR